MKTKTFISDLSKKIYPISELVNGSNIQEGILQLIQKDYPNFSNESNLALTELNIFRQIYLSDFLKKETGDLTALEQIVLKNEADHRLITQAVDMEDFGELTLGQKIADKVASFGGSWRFIISFFVFLALWILANVYLFLNQGFDPYPFILLNLILSCIASLQAPVIMMSQNRQEERDRERSKKDYLINLKSELEIRLLNEKIDHLMTHQQQELLEIQNIQVEMLNEITNLVKDKKVR
ncbi:DUF1003 domain-containing protein [Aquirufa ecclesiirivi]|uniref:DUF1003 domain-containing protein n=1 Tax=Aquirufa ecclesiirivi TaxID=2715124 RepID=A0ABT4JCT1_9BACT|nr:DUF1003 domain-containing protein [Aquirufa ecclesiirivi]MCZ2472230.1 DUF1003 domain-containing protein [Aquirufa ecclesiirivi]MCZ2474092.1 DUF1003 domain-containing protein [Aquirufa ecclesiirivi]MDF0693937.1 DUF1003 domain-containing protein [Aquirufa ecclesiirivi]NHC48615.1 DUF1003 domain-containing protein [Aquirufa ecclesiirivi]